MTHKNKSSLEIIWKHIKYLWDIISSLSSVVRKEAADFSKKLLDILTSEKEENEKVKIVENVIKNFKIQIILILKKEDSLNENDKNLIKVLFELPKRFDVNLLIKWIKWKLEQKDIILLLSEINHIENSETKEIIKSILEAIINKRHNFQNINQISNEIIEKIKKSEELLSEIILKLIRETNEEAFYYILINILNSNEILESDKWEIIQILYEKYYPTFLEISWIESKQELKVNVFLNSQKKGDEMIIETFMEVLKIKNKIFRYFIFKKLFSEINILLYTWKIFNNKEVDDDTKENIREFLCIKKENGNNAKKWKDFNKKETITEKVWKWISITKKFVKRELSEHKREKSRKKLLKELLLDLLWVNKKLNKIPTENQMLEIISNTWNYEWRKLLYDIYFRWIIWAEIEYSQIFDFVINEWKISKSSDFKNENLVKFLKEYWKKKWVLYNLKFVFKNININNFTDIFSTSLHWIITEKSLWEVKGIFKNFSEDGWIDHEWMIKLFNCDLSTLEIIKEEFNGITYSEIVKMKNLLQLLKIEEWKNFRKIKKNIKLFKKLFENLGIKNLYDIYFLESLRIFNPNTLEIFINLKENEEYKKGVWILVEWIIQSFLKWRWYEEKIDAEWNVTIVDNGNAVEWINPNNIHYQAKKFRNMFNSLEIKFNAEDLNLNFRNPFLISENVEIEKILIWIFKWIDKMSFWDSKDLAETWRNVTITLKTLDKLSSHLWEIVDIHYNLSNFSHYWLNENVKTEDLASNLRKLKTWQK